MVRLGYKQTEIGEIPEGWDEIVLGDFAIKVGSGITPKGGSTVYKDAGRPFVRSQNIGWGNLRLSDLSYIDEQTHQTFPATEVHSGDVLLNITGASIGRCSIANDQLAGGNVNQHVCIIRTNKGLDQKFVSYLILSSIGQKQIDSFQAGGNREGLNFGQIRSFILPKPKELGEQKAIARALSDVDELIVSLEKLIAKKRDIKTATMQQLLTGKKRLPGFGEGKGYKQTELGEIPEDWDVLKIEDISDIDPENLSSSTRPDYEFNYISLEDVNYGVLSNYSIQIYKSSPSRARRLLKASDVLVSTVRPNLKSHLLFNKQNTDWVCSTGFAVVRCSPKKSVSEYVFYHLFSGNIERQIETLIAGSNYPAISSKDVRGLKIPVPDITEQKAISIMISDMDSDLSSLAGRLEKTKAIKQGMMQELLTGRTRLVNVAKTKKTKAA